MKTYRRRIIVGNHKSTTGALRVQGSSLQVRGS